MNSSLATYNKTKELLKSDEIKLRFQEILGAKSQPFLALPEGAIAYGAV